MYLRSVAAAFLATIMLAGAVPANTCTPKTTTVIKTTTSLKTTTSIKTSTTTTTQTKTTSIYPTSTLQSFYNNYNFETDYYVVAEVPIGDNIREYNLLYFNMNLVNSTVAQPVGGVQFHTPVKAAVFSAIQPLLAAAYISKDYTESTLSYFNAVSWWYGCVLSLPNGDLSVPTGCTITATGFNTAGTLVAKQTFAYVANGNLVQDMTYAKFDPAFAFLDTIYFEVSNNLTTAALIDNFIAELFQNPNSVFF